VIEVVVGDDEGCSCVVGWWVGVGLMLHLIE
jgi:hypothetical protein